ncbi:hypothetical protein GFB56_26690 [Ensifer sp. T173]|uniref:Membrane protein n=2 Tax=Ensifer TaxID=106591 RepID=A0A0L8C7R0_ENSAD|nr:membrane protein [Ensifer adhaerens]MBM3094334.1 hypothetical protein [Ensifer canadensis]NOV15078.1 hypothetical protein [Ensifer canadensis]PSS60088.1 hypothetical protein C6558_35110 [Ensifer sp. NM-2]
MAALSTSAFLSLRVLALASLLMAPVGALAYSKANGLGIGKQGAGLVLFVTLQRQSMS